MRIASSSGPSEKISGPVALVEHQRRVEVPDQPGRGQLGVALDHHEGDLPTAGDLAQQRRLAGAGRALEQHVRPAEQGGLEDLRLAGTLDDGDGERVAPGRGGEG